MNKTFYAPLFICLVALGLLMSACRLSEQTANPVEVTFRTPV